MEAFPAAARAFLIVACREDARCAAGEERVGRELLRAGRPASSLEHFVRAAQLTPTVARWLKVAEIAESVDKLSLAVHALGRLDDSLASASAEEAGRVKTLRRKVTAGLLDGMQSPKE
jgi:hypothetical protein